MKQEQPSKFVSKETILYLENMRYDHFLENMRNDHFLENIRNDHFLENIRNDHFLENMRYDHFSISGYASVLGQLWKTGASAYF